MDEALFPESLQKEWCEETEAKKDPSKFYEMVKNLADHQPTADWKDYLRAKIQKQKPVHLIVRHGELSKCFELNAVLALMIERACYDMRIHFNSNIVKRTLMDGKTSGLRTVVWETLGSELPPQSDCELIVRFGVNTFDQSN